MNFKYLVAVMGLLASASGAMAGTYDALCGDIECQISVSAKGISSPSGFTPSSLISMWSVGKASDFNAGKAVAGGLGGATAGLVGGAILLGPVGALAGLLGGAVAGGKSGKEFEGFFAIVGYNKKGEKISHSFYFINEKPVKRLLMELPVVTGLALGEERELQEIEGNFAEDKLDISTDSLPARLGSYKSTQQNKKCWSEYLDNNPAMAVWAVNNPALSEKQRIKSGYENCEEAQP